MPLEALDSALEACDGRHNTVPGEAARGRLRGSPAVEKRIRGTATYNKVTMRARDPSGHNSPGVRSNVRQTPSRDPRLGRLFCRLTLLGVPSVGP